MCLLIVVSRVDDEAPLVVGANRDERTDRPANAMEVLHRRGPRILGGRDELAGGTWLAVNEHGVVAGLTNRPARAGRGRDPTKRSRGELPLALAMHDSARRAVDDFVTRFEPADYNPAWLLVGDRDSLFSVDMTGCEEPGVLELPPGIHVLENLPLGESSPKVDNVLELLGPVGRAADEHILERLAAVLSDHSLPRFDELAGRTPRTGAVRPQQEGTDPEARPGATLAACVHGEEYGTRSSTLVRVGADPLSAVTVLFTDGAPCNTPFVSAAPLWQTDTL